MSEQSHAHALPPDSALLCGVKMKKFSLATLGGDLEVWHVERLWNLSRQFPVRMVPLTKIACLDEALWFSRIYGVEATCRRVAAHARRIYDAQLEVPVILSASGRVMDGMHRVAKAWILGRKKIPAVKFLHDPEPDEILPLPASLRLGKKPARTRRAKAKRPSRG